MSNTLSDSELRRKLIENGVDAGPITDSTRYLYIRKLEKLNVSTSASPLLSPSTSQDVKNRRRSTPSRAAKLQSSLLGFSSEDSESENASDIKIRKRRRQTLTPTSLNVKIPISPLAIPSTSKSPTVPRSTVNLGLLTDRTNPDNNLFCGGNLTRAKLSTGRSSFAKDNFDSDFSDIEINSLLEKKSPTIGSSYRLLQSIRSFPQKTVQRFSSYQTTKDPGFQQHFQNGHRANSSFESEFRTEEDPKSTTNYSQCISWFLVGIVAIFFVIVGLIYVGVRQKDSNITLPLKNFSNHICRGFSYVNCIDNEDDLKVAVQSAYFLHNYLSELAGEYECKKEKLGERWVPVETIKAALQAKLEKQDEESVNQAFSNCIILIKNHHEWGIKILQVEGTDEIRALESTVSSKTLWCRISKAFNKVFKQIILAVLVVISIMAVGYFVKSYKKATKEREARLYSLVETILGTLQKHHELCKTNTELDPCLVIVHVRDMLIPLPQRSDNSRLLLWDQAVKLIKENESRVRVEVKRISGEDFLVWRWLQPTVSADARKGKIWQGQAFGNLEKGNNALPFCPTPCLKIRNMFDPEVEYGDDWILSVRDAVLEKCENNTGILHIHIDSSSKEGCVYVKCNSSEAAGKAYQSLHGWWFDGKLVTVKYLRLERYHERFPDSRQSFESLKPSNNLRLSIQDSMKNSNSLENS